MNRSWSTLFLIEQLIVIAVFAMCAAACARILTAAHFNATDSRDIGNAILQAENGAESFKAVSGDFETFAVIMGGTFDRAGGIVTVFFDNRWQVSSEADADYVLLLKNSSTARGKRIIFFTHLEIGNCKQKRSGFSLMQQRRTKH